MAVDLTSILAKVQRTAPTWGVFAAGVAVSLLVWMVAESRVSEHAAAKADAAIADASEAIQARLRGTYDVIYALQGLAGASDQDVTRGEFHRFVTGLKLHERHPSIRSVTYAERVSAAELPRLEARLRRDAKVGRNAYPPFSVKPEGRRPEYLPIVAVEPLSGHENAVGADLLAEERRETVYRARDTGEPAVSERFALPADASREPAFSVRLAVYRNGMPTGTEEERRAAFAGIVGATFLARTLVADILTHQALEPLSVALYDRFTVTGGVAVGARAVDQLLFEKAGPAALPRDHTYFTRNLLIDVGGRSWHLAFTGSTRAFVTQSDSALTWILLVGGLVMSALLASLVHSLASSRERARRMAEHITEDLRHSEARLAEAQRLTQSMIEALPNPIFFKSTDGRYRGVNQAWEKFFGIPRAAFIGKTVYDLYPGDRSIAERLDEMDQVLWKSPGSQVYEAVIPGADGARHDVVYYKATYTRGEGSVAGLIGTIIDISERKQAERRQTMEHAITKVLAQAESIPIAIPRIIQTVCETMGWHYGDRYEYEAESGLLRRREFWAVDTPEMQAFAAVAAHRAVRPDGTGSGLIRRTYTAGKPVWIADIAKHVGLQRKELIEKAGLHGAFAFPLVASGQVLGVMEFFHRDVREPDTMLIQIAESIGSQIGQFIVRMQAEEAVKFVAMHDALTHLPNRVMFNQRLEQAIAQAQRHEKRLAVMFIDLDRFKVINDTLGHEAGDQLLREVAGRITEHLRTGDIVARLGGDEFVVMLEDLNYPTAVGAVAGKLISSLTSNFQIAGREVHVSASIGIASFPDDAQDMRTLMKYADIAMYRAKEQGRNNFQFYSEQFNVHSVERLTLESGLRGALDKNELRLCYQPVMDVRTERIVGMEALVRWEHPSLGLLPPARFIGIAEESGIIVPIGEWVLQTACAQQQRWIAQGLPALRLAVNLSPRHFVHRHLVQDIARALAETSAGASFLELEITEGTVMHNAQRAIAVLNELKAMGIHIAIDDFGTGYSSLAYLKRFPLDSLKVDRSFVADVPRDAGDTAITQAIIGMAHSLGLRVIGEGVETAEQLEFLRTHGCDEAQGYYFGAPLAEAEATALLRESFVLPAASNVTPFGRRR